MQLFLQQMIDLCKAIVIKEHAAYSSVSSSASVQAGEAGPTVRIIPQPLLPVPPVIVLQYQIQTAFH